MHRSRLRSTPIFLLMLTTVVSACARRPAQAAAQVSIQVELRVTNNLGEPLELRASAPTGVLWSGSVGANSSVQASLGAMPGDATVMLRATNSRGAVISARENVQVRSGTLIWIIP